MTADAMFGSVVGALYYSIRVHGWSGPKRNPPGGNITLLNLGCEQPKPRPRPLAYRISLILESAWAAGFLLSANVLHSGDTATERLIAVTLVAILAAEVCRRWLSKAT